MAKLRRVVQVLGIWQSCNIVLFRREVNYQESESDRSENEEMQMQKLWSLRLYIALSLSHTHTHNVLFFPNSLTKTTINNTISPNNFDKRQIMKTVVMQKVIYQPLIKIVSFCPTDRQRHHGKFYLLPFFSINVMHFKIVSSRTPLFLFALRLVM